MDKKIVTYVLAPIVGVTALFLIYSAIHNHLFSRGMQEGWNLAVEQCKRNMDNCVISKHGK